MSEGVERRLAFSAQLLRDGGYEQHADDIDMARGIREAVKEYVSAQDQWGEVFRGGFDTEAFEKLREVLTDD